MFVINDARDFSYECYWFHKAPISSEIQGYSLCNDVVCFDFRNIRENFFLPSEPWERSIIWGYFVDRAMKAA
ncbi:hypothetical protein BaRGS_00015531, partial [Batillaria attramentaria]